ncbi:MAG: phosphatase [Lachnospiraceae bacterium]
MKFRLDTHTHTIASGHAYNTMTEMIKEAAAKGLELIGITEHAPAMPGSCHEFYFQNLRAVDREELRERYGIMVLIGAELNVMDENGTLDLPEPVFKQLDVTIASLHLPCLRCRDEKDNTNAVIRAIENPLVDIIGHPDDGRLPLTYEPIVEAAKKHGKLLEMNDSSLRPGGYRMGADENYRKMLKLCMEYEQPIVVDSDAHFITQIGSHAHALKILEEMNFPERLVMNTSVEKFLPYTRKYRQKQ